MACKLLLFIFFLFLGCLLSLVFFSGLFDFTHFLFWVFVFLDGGQLFGAAQASQSGEVDWVLL